MSVSCSISVVVPTYQRRDRVLRMLEAFRLQTFPSDRFEVVVSIDGSTDGTREALESLTSFPALLILWQPRKGRAAALNAGIEASRGELTVLLDDDMEPAPGFLDAHWSAHRDHPRLGVMGAVPIWADETTPSVTRYIAARFNGHLEKLACPDYVLRLTDFYSGNFSVRRDLLREVGGFDEEFQLYGNEDLELSFRLARVGVIFAYDAAALAVQHNDKDFAALAQDSVAEGRTAVRFALKHPEAYGQLKLGTYLQGPRVLRVIRDRLLWVSRQWPTFPKWLIRLEDGLARLRSVNLTRFHRLALGYFYWIGVLAAIDEQRNAGREVGPLARLAEDFGL